MVLVLKKVYQPYGQAYIVGYSVSQILFCMDNLFMTKQWHPLPILVINFRDDTVCTVDSKTPILIT